MSQWLPSDSHRLQQLRIAQKLDTFAFAQKCAISERQLLELEGEGEGCFYSEAIKYQTGLKLLRLLGDHAAESAVTTPNSRALSTQPLAQPLRVVPPSENHRLLQHIGLALVVSGVMVCAVNVLDGLGLRPGGVLTALIGLGIVWLARIGKFGEAVMLLCWGFLLMTFSSAWVSKGLVNVSWVAPPIAIMAAGWFLGRAMAWVLAVVSSLGALFFYTLHVQLYPFAEHVPIETVLAGLLVAFAIAALIAGAISETYGRQFDLIRESRAELLAVMDSTRSMIWSVAASDFSLRTFNHRFERAIADKEGVTLTQGLLPSDMFSQAEAAERWVAAYRKAIDNDGWAWEEDVFGDGRRFEVSCQPIRQNKHVIGIAVFAQELDPPRQ